MGLLKNFIMKLWILIVLIKSL